MKITKEWLMGDILDHRADLAQVLMMMGMHCVGCPSSRGESLEEACRVHQIEVEQVVNALNHYLEQNP